MTRFVFNKKNHNNLVTKFYRKMSLLHNNGHWLVGQICNIINLFLEGKFLVLSEACVANL